MSQTERPRLKTFHVKIPVHIFEKGDPTQGVSEGMAHQLDAEVDAYSKGEVSQILSNALVMALRAASPRSVSGGVLLPLRPLMPPPDEGGAK